MKFNIVGQNVSEDDLAYTFSNLVGATCSSGIRSRSPRAAGEIRDKILFFRLNSREFNKKTCQSTANQISKSNRTKLANTKCSKYKKKNIENKINKMLFTTMET